MSLINVDKFRFFSQVVLPAVYDESLSYYEVLNKVRYKLNEVVDSTNSQNKTIKDFINEVNNNFDNFVNKIIGKYDSSKEYSKGYYCWHNDKVYKANDDTTGVFDDSKWDEVIFGDAVADDVNNYIEKVDNLISQIAPAYRNYFTYQVGEMCVYNDEVYVCTTAINPPENFNTEHWNKAIITTELKNRVDNYWEEFIDNYERTFGIVQTTGDSTTDVMSQAAVTQELTQKTNNTDFAKTIIYRGSYPDSTNINTLLDNGWYRIKNSASAIGFPADWNGTRNGFLLTYKNSITSAISLQYIVESTSMKMWTRYIYTDGSVVGDWVKFAFEDDVNAVNTALSTAVSGLINRSEIEKDFNISLNGNYFDANEADWSDGQYTASNGNVAPSSTLQYSYCKLQGTGDYVLLCSKSQYGSTNIQVAFCDKNKTWIKYKNGVRDDNSDDAIHFSVTDSDLANCYYIVVRRHKTTKSYVKVFYNARFINDFYPMKINYGFTSDNLYKKKVICDGDSICKGANDKPYEFGAWFGRLQRDYQITGQNYAVNGGTIMDKTNTEVSGNPRHSVCLNIDTIHNTHTNTDYLILEGGVNDADLVGNFVGDTPPEDFGTWNIDDFTGNYTETTFCGGVESMFYKATTYYPNAKIGFIIAMEMGTNNTAISRRKRYFDEIVKIANKWHIPVLNLWEECHADARLTQYYDSSKTGTENVTAKSFYFDGQHPTSYGYELMQNLIVNWIKNL